jgi:hypothetical protein
MINPEHFLILLLFSAGRFVGYFIWYPFQSISALIFSWMIFFLPQFPFLVFLFIFLIFPLPICILQFAVVVLFFRFLVMLFSVTILKFSVQILKFSADLFSFLWIVQISDFLILVVYLAVWI